nr:ATP-dependent DNA helicase PcrA [Candidatus Anoxychlamydiales bacterium]
VLDFYQKRWPFILIDEYQDTNFVQYTIAKMLSLKSQNICVVGDPDQSIYSWRGARYQNILNFDSDFKDATIIKLETNYRSTPTILKAANELIKNNSSRFEKNLKSDLEDGEKIKIFKADTEKMEAAFVVEKILKYQLKDQKSLKDITIFYRTNFQSRVFEDILLENQIPYIIYGGLSFYQRKEIKDILAFLRLLILNSDFLAFSRTINIPKRGFGKTTISKLFFLSEKNGIPIIPFLKKLQQDPSSYPEIRLNLSQKNNLENYLKSLFEIRELYQQNIDLDELISHILTKMKYLEYLKEDPISFEDRKENIDELITKANQAYENNQSLEKFLEDIALATTKIENAKDDSLKLMTLHNSKGLEFETVFIVGLEEDLFPHVNSKNSIEEIEEERRLFYVGMTRAKKNLYITHSLSRYMFGGVKLSLPSRFLKELDAEYIEDLSTPYQQNYRDFYGSKPTFSKPKVDTDYISSSASYSIGQKVFHKTFGKGSVKKVYQTSLGETLDILFEGSHHMRSLVTKYAKLKIL